MDKPKSNQPQSYTPLEALDHNKAKSIAKQIASDKNLEFSITDNRYGAITFKDGCWLPVQGLGEDAKNAVTLINIYARHEKIFLVEPLVVNPSNEHITLPGMDYKTVVLTNLIEDIKFSSVKDLTINSGHITPDNALEIIEAIKKSGKDITINIQGFDWNGKMTIQNGECKVEHEGRMLPSIQKVEDIFKEAFPIKTANLSAKDAAVAALASFGVSLQEPHSMPIGNYAPVSSKANGVA